LLPRLWPLIARMIDLRVGRFNVTVIMTTIHPRLIDTHGEHDVIELIDDPARTLAFYERILG
jgi:hypothetical protein